MSRSFHRPAGLALGLAALAAALAIEPGAPSARAEEAPPAAEDPAAPLPTVEVDQRPVHAVPEGDVAPAAPVTIKGRDGRETALRAPPVPAHYRPSAPPVTSVSGAARVVDVVSLNVLGRAIRLFGVRAPQPGDRCAAAEDSELQPCRDSGRAALEARLAANAQITCKMPPGQRAPVPAAVCRDAGGRDLGAMLVSEGFALADPAQSYDYFDAEAAARQLRRGLWRYR
jgi:endonuclease YncB( thermonuclease family)